MIMVYSQFEELWPDIESGKRATDYRARIDQNSPKFHDNDRGSPRAAQSSLVCRTTDFCMLSSVLDVRNRGHVGSPAVYRALKAIRVGRESSVKSW